MKEDRKKIKVLDNDFYRKQTAANKKIVARNKRYLRHKIIMRTIYGIGILATVLCLFQAGQNLWQARNVTQQTKTAQTKLNEAKKDNADLKLRVKQLNDQDYLEKLIREKYYYSRDGETIYNLPEEKASSILSSEK